MKNLIKIIAIIFIVNSNIDAQTDINYQVPKVNSIGFSSDISKCGLQLFGFYTIALYDDMIVLNPMTPNWRTKNYVYQTADITKVKRRVFGGANVWFKDGKKVAFYFQGPHPIYWFILTGRNKFVTNLKSKIKSQ